MSGTLKPLILATAVELWRDAEARCRQRMIRYNLHGEAHQWCALGVLGHARECVTGNSGHLDNSAALIGFKKWDTVAAINDFMPFGQRYLYWRMKRALHKAKAAA